MSIPRSRFAQPFLFKICMFCASTRPRYQVSVYRTIGPLVFIYGDMYTFAQSGQSSLYTGRKLGFLAIE